MYEILMDGKELWCPGDSECVVFAPTLAEALNDSGYIEFTVPPVNPLYGQIFEQISMIQVLKDDKEMFYGIVKETAVNFRKEKRVYAVGILSFLADSIQPQKRFQDVTPYAFISELIQRHNEQVEERKRFEVGAVTVKDPNDSIYRYTNYDDTLTALREKICDRLGGFLKVRHVGSRNILDVVTLGDYGKNCDQAIEFGENLLDYAESTTTDEIATAVLPRGHQLEESPIEGLTAYLTIESVNNGRDYVYNEAAVKRFGWIKRVVDFEDITVPENLLKKAREWLTDKQFADLTLNLSAVDLSVLDKDIQSFELGDHVHAIAEPYGMDSWFPVQQKTTCLSDASQNTIVLSNTVQKSYTQQQVTMGKDIQKKIPQKSELLQDAKNNASALIKQATNGYIVLKMDDEGNPCELLIMDSKNIDKAQKVWRWNLNGFGYSRTGYDGEYGLAMTMDGAIVADFITAGTMYADRIRGGTLKLGGKGNVSGTAQICNEDGKVLVTLDKEGITLDQSVKIAWENLDDADNKVTTLTEDTIKTTNVVAENLHVKTANIEGELSADKIRGGALKLGGKGNISGTAQICNEDGNVLVTLDKEGITLAQSVKIAWENLDDADNKVTTLTEDTIKTTNVVAENLRVKTANIEGELSADQITSGTLQGVKIISNDKESHSVQISEGEIKGYQGKTEVGSLDYSNGTKVDGTIYPSMRWRAQQAMSIKTPRLFISENPDQTADVTRCQSGTVTVMTSANTSKQLKFINGLLVTAL